MKREGWEANTVTVEAETAMTANASSRIQSALSGKSGPALDIERGDFIDRYVVLEEIGAGGMGVVFKALDPELERRVAIKLLRPGIGSQSTEGRARLVREGQAIAQLSHPNVVAVHDIGLFRDEMFFVAMEYVEGKSLRQWLKEEKRSHAEILAVFKQAAQGLAAAHAKGIIHRDFKPDNALIGDDGRVRVVDFGLARAEGDTREREYVGDSTIDEQIRSGTASLSESLTRTGDVMGTPAYMAPEQHRGEFGDARTDQFSFCVSLYRALCDQSPFRGNTCAAGCHEEPLEVRSMPREAQVSSWLERLILRGLAKDPDDRHESMEFILEELGRDRGRRRRAIMAGGFALLTVGAAVTIALAGTSEAQVCQGATERFGEVWNDEVGSRVEQAFIRTERPYAGKTFEKVQSAITEYGAEWQQMYVDACEATRVHGVQSTHLLDLRMACMDRRLSEAKALIALFSSEPDASQLDHAAQAVHALPAVASCANRDSLEAIVPLPEDPAVRARIDEAQSRLDRAAALELTGKFPDALSIAEEVAAETESLGYDPVDAEALHQVGRLQYRTGDPAASEETFTRALRVAARAHNLELVARILSELIVVVGYFQGEFEAGHAYYNAAHGIAASTPISTMTQVHMLKNIGVVLNRQGRYDEALPYHQKVLELLQGEFGDEHPYTVKAFNLVGTVYATQGKTELALEYFHRALAIAERTDGPEHPELFYHLNNIGEMLQDQEKYDEARVYLERAVAVTEQALGTEHPRLFYSLNNLGDGYAEQERCEEAIPRYQRALEVRSALRADHPDTASPLSGIGSCYLQLGRANDALAPLEKALKLLEAGNDDPNVIAEVEFRLARAIWATGGDRNRAIALARSAKASWDRPEAARWKKQLHAVDAWLADHG